MAPPSSPSSGDEDTCYVFWKTESILANSSFPTPILPSRTPTKRSTTIAALPSPSTSTAASKPARFSKRRRPVVKEKSEGMDEATLKTMGVLAARLSGRSSSGGSAGSVGRSEVLRDKTGNSNLGRSSVEKGKGKEVDRGVQGAWWSLAVRMDTGADGVAGVGSRSTPLGAQRSLPIPIAFPTPVSRSTSLLGLSRSKPFVNGLPKPPSPVVPLPAIAIAIPPLPKVVPAPAAEEAEDEFDSFYPPDDSFDLALSQLDVLAAIPVPALPRPKTSILGTKAPITTSLPRVVAPPTRASPRLAPRPPPKALPAKPPAPRLVPRATVAPNAARPPTVQPRIAVPARTVPAVQPAVNVAKGTAFRFGTVAGKKEVVIRGTGGKEMEEMVQRELEALEAEGGGDWSDGSF